MCFASDHMIPVFLSVFSFALLGLPAALVNSFLKYETSMLSLCFRDRLTRHLNERYVSGVNFYKVHFLARSCRHRGMYVWNI